MNVKELKELLATAPDEMEVMVMVEDHLNPGMFAFASACTCETGISEIGTEEDGGGESNKVFLVLPHGAGISEDEIDTDQDIIPELN
jgi:hypothetical protein